MTSSVERVTRIELALSAWELGLIAPDQAHDPRVGMIVSTRDRPLRLGLDSAGSAGILWQRG